MDRSLSPYQWCTSGSGVLGEVSCASGTTLTGPGSFRKSARLETGFPTGSVCTDTIESALLYMCLGRNEHKGDGQEW